MRHSNKCVAWTKEFTDKYPNYCRSCGGWGGFAEYNYPNELDGFEICDDCIGSFEMSSLWRIYSRRFLG